MEIKQSKNQNSTEGEKMNLSPKSLSPIINSEVIPESFFCKKHVFLFYPAIYFSQKQF